MKKSQWIKRILCMAMVVMLLTGLATSALAVGRSSTHAKKGDQYYVVCSRLNVRSGAGMGYSIKGTAKRGSKLTFQYASSGWWYVKFSNGLTGFIDKQFVTPVSVPKATTYKTTAKLMVRSKPKTSAKGLGTLKKGAKVTVLQLNGDWVRISYKGKTGWIRNKYLKKVK